MRYLIALDRERSEGVLSTETGIVLRYVKEEGMDVFSVYEKLTDKIPFHKKYPAIHVSYADRADSVACDRLEKDIKVFAGEKTAVLCEDRMVHRIYSAFHNSGAGIVLYVSPDAGAGRLYGGGLAVLGGMGAPIYSEGAMFALSVKTIRAALAFADKIGRPTVLASLLEEAMGVPIEDVKNELKNLGIEKIATYARLAAKGKLLGDTVSVSLWNDMILSLSQYVHALSGTEEHISVKFTEVPPFLQTLLTQDLAACLGERYTVSVSKTPILLGGIKRAAEMLGISADETFVRTLLETYKNFEI